MGTSNPGLIDENPLIIINISHFNPFFNTFLDGQKFLTCIKYHCILCNNLWRLIKERVEHHPPAVPGIKLHIDSGRTGSFGGREISPERDFWHPAPLLS